MIAERYLLTGNIGNRSQDTTTSYSKCRAFDDRQLSIFICRRIVVFYFRFSISPVTANTSEPENDPLDFQPEQM
jgi:hypothetical protein